MRTAAGLDLSHLNGLNRVADIEDTQATEPIRAHVLANPVASAVHTSAGLFHRHEQQIADDGDVALTTGAYDRTDQLRRVPLAETIQVEAMIIADREQIAGKRHVGVGEAEERSPLAETVLRILGSPSGLFAVGFGREGRRQAHRIARVVEAGRLGQVADQAEMTDRLPRITVSSGESRARILRELA
ncbi:hypothetical protein D3C72_977480 [compost metagenome]